ncbi:molybdopterin cofactor-binding domain-containing protein [uncultured Litoreibacter sp.]|uniref:xanthine dehydrogenase family protein molybdopterin-binding subunit n=1 Tax=uncultured Litoreibacter sp. TaxID=1392394 RepID=UPI00262354F0|nr:molybdopterin cofactor-binding domain-containing protein [uncultured Litoreibacter sp.]
MGRARTIARRTFLIGSAAIAGGVAFGIYKVRTPHDNPLAEGLGKGEATFNPFVKITPEKITLITPHADIGQGVVHMQAALIAEELDVEFGQFETDFGAPAPAYWNTALSAEAVPFASFDESFGARTMRGMVGSVTKLLGVMGTGGSSSAPDQYEKLRAAGAVARETLKLAASQQSGVAVDELKTANGAVQLPDGTSLAYTELAEAASGLDPVSDVTLRDPSTWRLIGKPMARKDIPAKTTGTQIYGIDLKLDGMVYASTRVSPRRGAMNGYEANGADTMPGVSSILPVTGGVAVVANSTWRAMNAANQIEFDWADAPYPAEQDAHWEEVAASFTEKRLDKEWRADGDVDAAMDGAEVISSEYRAGYVAHQPLEPLNAIVRADKNGAEVWTGHQLPRFLQQKVAAIVGCEPDDVIYHNQYSGGSFGHRLEWDNVTQAAEIAVQMRGTPVKLTLSREEDFATDYPRQIGMSRSKGTAKDGKVDSWSLDIATVSAARSMSGRLGVPVPGPDTQIAAGAWAMAYGIPNLRVRAYAVPELAPTSSWRSVGASTAGFFAESFLDELIHAAGADPIEERLRLCNNDVHRKVLEAVAEMSGWGTPMGDNQGRGVALVESFGVPVAQVIEVTNTDAGIKIDRVYVAADVGRVIDPVNFENLVQGGVVWALGHAINSEITYSDGMAEQTNYHASEGMRMHQAPEIIVKGLENAEKIRGIGEPPVPAAPPALANAIFAATGQRIREMPFNKHIDFV